MTTPTDYKKLAEAVICKASGCDCSIECQLARAVLALDAERTAWRKLAEDNDRIAMEETTKRETLDAENQRLRAALAGYREEHDADEAEWYADSWTPDGCPCELCRNTREALEGEVQ